MTQATEHKLQVEVGVLQERTINMEKGIDEIKEILKEDRKNFVTKDEHSSTVSSVRMLGRWFVVAVVGTFGFMGSIIFFLLDKLGQ